MSFETSKLASTLHQHGHSLTQPRQAIFTALQNNQPQTLRQLRVACPDIDRASTYRTVMLFEKLGIIHQLHFGWKHAYELSELFSPHHHHLVCAACGAVETLAEDQAVEQHLRDAVHALGFTIDSHQIEIRGLCPACQKATNVRLA